MIEILILVAAYFALKPKQPTTLNASPVTDANVNSGLGATSGGSASTGLQVVPGSIQPTTGATQNGPASSPDSYGGSVNTAPIASGGGLDDGFPPGMQGQNGTDLSWKQLGVIPAVGTGGAAGQPTQDPTVENSPPPATLVPPAGVSMVIADQPPAYAPLTPNRTFQSIAYPIAILPAPITYRTDTAVPMYAPENGGAGLQEIQ